MVYREQGLDICRYRFIITGIENGFCRCFRKQVGERRSVCGPLREW